MPETRYLKDDLDIIENRAWQERFWSIQRLAWILMLLILVSAVLGATGSGGPLATGHVDVAGGVVHYPRIARWQTTSELTVELPSQAQGPTDVQLSKDLLEVFSVESMSPLPREASTTPAGHRYTFDVNGDRRKTIVFFLRPMRAALPSRGKVTVGNGPSATLNFVILP